MYRLAIDTSCEKSSLAIEKDGVLIVSLEHQSQKLQTGFFSLIDRVFEENEINPFDVDHVITGIGPGSFTGVRIGVSFAKTYCQLTGAKLTGVPSFFLSLAEYIPNRYYISVIPSTRTECYAVLFHTLKNNRIEMIHSIDDGKPDRIIDLAGNLPDDSELVIYGEGVGMVRDLVFSKKLKVRFLASDDTLPKAERAFGFVSGHEESCISGDPMILVPFYVRPSPAELVWMKREGN
jgi:tRNA threonylcarbamoyladenosine biosynthesis protein TsaB